MVQGPARPTVCGATVVGCKFRRRACTARVLARPGSSTSPTWCRPSTSRPSASSPASRGSCGEAPPARPSRRAVSLLSSLLPPASCLLPAPASSFLLPPPSSSLLPPPSSSLLLVPLQGASADRRRQRCARRRRRQSAPLSGEQSWTSVKRQHRREGEIHARSGPSGYVRKPVTNMVAIAVWLTSRIGRARIHCTSRQTGKLWARPHVQNQTKFRTSVALAHSVTINRVDCLASLIAIL